MGAEMKNIIGTRIYSRLYGEGIIVNEEDGLIWIDFSDKKNVCFQATASLTGENPFLKSDDQSIIEYLNYRIKIEKDIQIQNETIENMKKLGIDDQYIEAYKSGGQKFLFTSNCIKEIKAESEPYLYDSIIWFETNFDSKVYAVFAIPNIFGNEIFTYAFLEQRCSIEVKGNLAFTFAYYLNPNCEHCGENRPLGIQITSSGLYALPEEFSSFVWKYFDK
jgi:hypothetical protein